MGRMTAFMALLPCFMLLFGTRGFYVYGSCMEPNLKTGERVLAVRFAYMLGGPKRGDVVIFKYPCDPSKNYVKRVVGLPGDTVEIRDGEGAVFDDQLGFLTHRLTSYRVLAARRMYLSRGVSREESLW